MGSRLGANAPIYLVLINTLDKNEINIYNNRTSENRGIKMKNNKHKETIFVWWMIAVICWVFLRIGTDIHKTRKFDEAMERASERAIKRDEIASTNKISRNRERHLGKSGEKSLHFNLYLKLIKKYIAPHGCEGFLYG